MTIGLTAGMRFMLYALCVTGIFCLIMVLLRLIRFASPRRIRKILKITVPEDVNYQDAFKDILERYATNIVAQKVRTTDPGSLFKVSFALTMPDRTDEKIMIDELRVRNGNLPILLILQPQLPVSEYR